MVISKKSPRTGKVNTMDLPVTKLELWRWKNGEFIKNVMPHLNDDQREFLMTGYTPEDWDAMFLPEEDE